MFIWKQRCAYYLCAEGKEETGKRNYVGEHSKECVSNEPASDAIHHLLVNVQS
jgi:hypothetical protein